MNRMKDEVKLHIYEELSALFTIKQGISRYIYNYQCGGYKSHNLNLERHLWI